VTWPLPEPAAGAELGLKLGELGELGELGAGESCSDGRSADPPAGEPPPGTVARAWPAAPGRATATAAAVTALASATVAVTEPTLARAASRAAARWGTSVAGEP
jgi:hypothetical protein